MKLTTRKAGVGTWSELAKAAGMKYIGLTARHHDGGLLTMGRTGSLVSTLTPRKAIHATAFDLDIHHVVVKLL